MARSEHKGALHKRDGRRGAFSLPFPLHFTVRNHDTKELLWSLIKMNLVVTIQDLNIPLKGDVDD